MTAALAMTADELTHHLGGLPASRRFCADLAVRALHDGIRAYQTSSSEPHPPR